MPRLDTTISPGLWQALVDHAQRTHESLAHIVSAALAEYLQVTHHTLYQVSTSTALVEGIYQGAARVGTLREHGDLGLGTFEDLDGEMVVVDGQFFQARSVGSVPVVQPSARPVRRPPAFRQRILRPPRGRAFRLRPYTGDVPYQGRGAA